MVSIILPTYNRAHLIKESINSVLQQTYPDFELLIIDDGSDDNTAEVISAISDNRVRYFKIAHEGHIGKLKNFAIQHSAGDFIAFIDSDDLWKSNKLEKQMQLFAQHPYIGFSVTDVTTFSRDKVLIDHSYKLTNTVECINIFERLINNQFLVYNPTLIMRKECFLEVGHFNEEMMCGGHHFVMRLAYFFDAGIIYDTLVLRRVHDSNISEQLHAENYNEYIDTFEYLYKHKMLKRMHLLKAKTNAYFKLGKIHDLKGEKKQALLNYFKSIKYGIPVPLHFLRLWRNVKSVKRT